MSKCYSENYEELVSALREVEIALASVGGGGGELEVPPSVLAEALAGGVSYPGVPTLSSWFVHMQAENVIYLFVNTAPEGGQYIERLNDPTPHETGEVLIGVSCFVRADPNLFVTLEQEPYETDPKSPWWGRHVVSPFDPPNPWPTGSWMGVWFDRYEVMRNAIIAHNAGSGGANDSAIEALRGAVSKLSIQFAEVRKWSLH